MVDVNVRHLPRFTIGSNVVSARSIRMIRSSQSTRNDSGNVISLPRLMVPSARLMCSGGYPKIIKYDISSDWEKNASTLSVMRASTTNDNVFLSALSSTIGFKLVIAPTGFPGFESRIKTPWPSCDSVCCSVNALLKMSAIGSATISDPHFSRSPGNSSFPLARLLLRQFVERPTSV